MLAGDAGSVVQIAAHRAASCREVQQQLVALQLGPARRSDHSELMELASRVPLTPQIPHTRFAKQVGRREEHGRASQLGCRPSRRKGRLPARCREADPGSLPCRLNGCLTVKCGEDKERAHADLSTSGPRQSTGSDRACLVTIASAACEQWEEAAYNNSPPAGG
jgi:hypothetical protein